LTAVLDLFTIRKEKECREALNTVLTLDARMFICINLGQSHWRTSSMKLCGDFDVNRSKMFAVSAPKYFAKYHGA